MTSCVYLLAAYVMLPAAAQAQAVAGPYVDLGGGVNFLENQIEKPYDGYGPAERTFRFDPGATAYAAGGYGLGNGLRLEAEGDFINNIVRGIRFRVPLRAGGHDLQYGGLLNVIYDINLNLLVTPYVGVGAGYQEVGIDDVNSSRYAVADRAVEKIYHGEFAYQGIAGFSYPVAFVPGLSLTADYRFLGVLTPAPYYRGTNGNNRGYFNGVLQTYRGVSSNILNNQVTLGVRYAFGAPPMPPPPAPAPVSAAPPAPIPARTYLVFFDWDRADLTDRARQIVGEAAQAATHVQTTRIEVNGYTDLSGTAVYNQRLSVRRAQSVQAELVRDGVPDGEISIHGYGESSPLVATAQGVREPQNRRVRDHPKVEETTFFSRSKPLGALYWAAELRRRARNDRQALSEKFWFRCHGCVRNPRQKEQNFLVFFQKRTACFAYSSAAFSS